MKPFLFAFFVALASARPEAPGGYSYPSPGVIANSGISGGHGIGGGSIGGLSIGGGSLGGGLGLSGGSGISSGFDSSSSFSSGGGGFGGGGFGGHSAGPTIHKHVYVHVAPEEPEVHHAPKVYPVAAAQKHYKIIFIKAPSAPNPTAPIIPAQPQNEEKTLVYVLVKKPEEQPDIHIPAPVPTQPSKPEVYFIRYKTQKEISGGHGAGIGGGIGGGAGIGGGIGGGAGLSGIGVSGGGGDLSGGDLSGHGGGISGGDVSGGVGSLDGSLGGGLSAGTSAKYGPPGYHK